MIDVIMTVLAAIYVATCTYLVVMLSEEAPDPSGWSDHLSTPNWHTHTQKNKNKKQEHGKTLSSTVPENMFCVVFDFDH